MIHVHVPVMLSSHVCLDLSPTQPATVSRCGMVYMEPSAFGWRPLLASWLATLPAPLTTDENRKLVQDLFDWLVQPCLNLVRKHLKVSQTTASSTIAIHCLFLMYVLAASFLCQYSSQLAHNRFPVLPIIYIYPSA